MLKLLLLAAVVVARPHLQADIPKKQDIGANCVRNPAGGGPQMSPDTPEAFATYKGFNDAALTAAPPFGYKLAYANQNQTYSNRDAFVAYIELTKYDVFDCANLCDSITSCDAFTIYFSRAPLLSPTLLCPDPLSTTRIKCTLFSGPITGRSHMTDGGLQQHFRTVIAGANAYTQRKSSPTHAVPAIPGWTTDVYTAGGAIVAPDDCYGNNTYLGARRWADSKHDIPRCVELCEKNVECNFVNTYLQRGNGTSDSQHCAMYTVHWPDWYATNLGQDGGEGAVRINNTASYGFTRADGKSYEACEVVGTEEGEGVGVRVIG